MLTRTVFFCKSARSLPYMSAKYRSTSWWYKARAFFINVPIKDTHGRVIDVEQWPKNIDMDGHMTFGTKGAMPETEDQKPGVKPDVVVFATGYRREVRFLDATYPQPTTVAERGVYNADDVSVAFIGFIRPGFGMSPREPNPTTQSVQGANHHRRDPSPRGDAGAVLDLPPPAGEVPRNDPPRAPRRPAVPELGRAVRDGLGAPLPRSRP